jgi:hypothetical protein
VPCRNPAYDSQPVLEALSCIASEGNADGAPADADADAG